ncbi:InlB B-repeat-containing protein, partial [Candidatus Saccharibacteria bacterium]|nr:InlB B-repeat-containing protein [Candidatus Saccharibacteria bacterium]
TYTTSGTSTNTQSGSVSTTSLTLSDLVPVRTGYDFIGWCSTTTTTTNNTDSCSGTIYNPNGAGTNLVYGIDQTTENITTIYAMWKQGNYTISYNANNGTGSISDQTVTPGSSVVLADNAFTRSNYYFMGWSTSSTATTPTYRTNQTITPTGNMTLYAVWGSSTSQSLYNVVASLTRGNQTNDTDATTGIKTNPTKATSGVWTYNATTFGTASDASTSNAIYYYRGILDATTGSYGSNGDAMDYPNYVKLGITCWRIVRTTGSGGVKMVYNGMYGNTTSGSCANATTAAQIRATSATTADSTATFTSVYTGTDAAQYRSIVGVGYTRNNTYAATSATTAKAYSTLFGTNSSYSGNSTNSTIKDNIETWFTNNLNSYASKLEASAGYCNDRTLYPNGSYATSNLVSNSTTIVPYGTSSMTAYYFGAYTRNSSTAQTPTLACPRSTVDLYTTSSASNGNKQLSKPVALLTADEMSFAGSGNSAASFGSGYNANSYLRSGSFFWLLSPFYRAPDGYTNEYFLRSNGYLDYSYVNNSYGVRPAISLASGTTAASGSGTATDPWVIEGPTAMQDLTLSQCQKNVGTNGNATGIGDEMTVYDKRDGNDYTVRYINGECWMTQNLRFTNTSVPTATSNTTADKTLTYYSLDSSNAGNFNAYTSATCGTGSTAGYTHACVYDSGDTTTGVWYNYYAATAGTVSGSSNSTAASQDICPKNWHLPSGPSTTSNTDFNKLVGNTSSDWQDPTTGLTAFGAVAGGTYNNGSLSSTGAGHWWSATAVSTTNRYRLYYISNDGQFVGHYQSARYLGFSVRCVRSS